MKKISFIAISLIWFFHGRANCSHRDTCIYDFVQNGAIANLDSILNLQDILKSNRGKEFYIASIRAYDAPRQERRITLKECSNINSESVVLFDGHVIDFDYKNIMVDTSVLFNHVGDNKMVMFDASDCGVGFHSDLMILLCKIRDKCFVGYSIDGSDVMAVFQQIVRKYFIISEDRVKDKFLTILNFKTDNRSLNIIH